MRLAAAALAVGLRDRAAPAGRKARQSIAGPTSVGRRAAKMKPSDPPIDSNRHPRRARRTAATPGSLQPRHKPTPTPRRKEIRFPLTGGLGDQPMSHLRHRERSVASRRGSLTRHAFCARVAASSLVAAGELVASPVLRARLDVLGGIADYSGSPALALPLAAAALAAAQLWPDGLVEAVSGDRRIVLPADDLFAAPLTQLSRRFAGGDAWAAYVLGPIALLAREKGVEIHGLRILVRPTSRRARASAPRPRSRSQTCRPSPPVSHSRSSRAGSPSSGSGPSSCRAGAVRRHGPDGGGVRLGTESCSHCSAARPRSSARSRCRRRSSCGASTPASLTRSPASATGVHGVPRSWARRCSAAATSTWRHSSRPPLQPARLPEQLTGHAFLKLGLHVEDPFNVIEPRQPSTRSAPRPSIRSGAGPRPAVCGVPRPSPSPTLGRASLES